MGFRSGRETPGVYRADGAFGQYLIVFPDLDMVVAITETASSVPVLSEPWILCGTCYCRQSVSHGLTIPTPALHYGSD